MSSYLRIGACSQSLGELRPDLDFGGRLIEFESLDIGVDGGEVDALHPGPHHGLDGVTAAAAHTHNFYLGGHTQIVFKFEHKSSLKNVTQPGTHFFLDLHVHVFVFGLELLFFVIPTKHQTNTCRVDGAVHDIHETTDPAGGRSHNREIKNLFGHLGCSLQIGHAPRQNHTGGDVVFVT